MEKGSLPRHIALIMDGNGRWAKKRLMPRVMGHRQGKNTLKALIQHCGRLGIEILTVYAFSSENWQRPDEEVSFLMKLFLESLQEELREMHHNGMRVNFIGDVSVFSTALQEIMAKAEALTAKNQGMIFNIAVNYGARAEILRAAKEVVSEIEAGCLDLAQLSEAQFEQFLYTKGLPDPDLLIRTSGESRISNFLLWQCAYTELYFTDTLFPDFKPAQLDQALEWYAGRERRYGKISEQI